MDEILWESWLTDEDKKVLFEAYKNNLASVPKKVKYNK